MLDFITILKSRGPVLTKTWQADGTIRTYDKAKTFTFIELPLDDIQDLHDALVDLSAQSTRCVIRGRAAPDRTVTVERNLETFHEVPHHWVCMDIDGYDPILADPVSEPQDACLEFVYRHLPPGFHGVDFIWQLSSSAGHPTSEGKLKAHLWFWLAKPRTGDELDAWARHTWAHLPKSPVDVTTFRTVQVHYTAAPLFAPGVVDPVAVRMGWFRGVLSDEADLDIPAAALLAAARERKGRAEMVDPSAKPGLVGAFCRAFTPEAVIDQDLCDGLFVWEDDDRRRITWTQGGGAQGGVCVTDDGAHLYSSHNTDPLEGRAANAWDFVRTHRFGHLDVDLTDFERDDPAQWPSQKAMVEWARALPEVQAELQAVAVESAISDISTAMAPGRRPIDDALDLVRACSDAVALESQVMPQLGLAEWLDTERTQLVEAARARVKELTGVRPPAARKVEGWLRAAAPKRDAMPSPDWLDDWVYITDGDLFFHLRTKEKVSPRGFDAKNSHHMPLREDGVARESAAFWAVNVWSVKTADAVLYAPGLADVFTMAGRTWANAYREDSVPDAEPVNTPGAQEAIRRFEDHLRLLFPDDTERGILLSWMAHNVQHPGRKIRWAPYIQGPTGAGKTFIAEVMSMCMGPQNVRVLSNSTLHAPFTPWVTGHALIVLEEIHQTGKGYETADILKAPVSNDTIDVHRKGKDAYQAPNFTNYLALSNHADGVPIDDTDRRWLFLQCAVSQRDAEKLGQSYFDPLFERCREHQGALRAWLLSLPMHGAFNAHDRAYKTAARSRIIEMCKSDDAVTVADYAEGRDFVSLGELEARLQRAGGWMPKSRAIKKTLETLGFKWLGRLTVDKIKHTVYVRDHLGWGQDRARLEVESYLRSGKATEDFVDDQDKIAA